MAISTMKNVYHWSIYVEKESFDKRVKNDHENGNWKQVGKMRFLVSKLEIPKLDIGS